MEFMGRWCNSAKQDNEIDEKVKTFLGTPLVTIGLDAEVGHHGVRYTALSLFARLEALNRRIPTPPQCQIDPLQHDVMDF